MYFNYQYPTYNKDKIKSIMDDFNIGKLTAAILLNKGLKSKKEIDRYLNPHKISINTSSNFKEFKGAANLLKKTIDNNNKIVIYGDYDADGVTSTAQLLRFLRVKKSKVNFFIPHREKDGYGLNINRIKDIIKLEANVLVTVDCGITNREEVKLAKDKGLKVIIVDHHSCDNELPEADYIINPKIYDEKDNLAHLCGAGLTYKLIEYMIDTYYSGESLAPYIQLSAIGTISDIVKLKGENRAIVKKGLEAINTLPITGISALKQIINKGVINSGDIGYKIGPMINSSGRLDYANNAVKLLSSRNMEEALSIGESLNQLNEDRKEIERIIYKEAEDYIEKNCKNDNILIVKGESWHEGVIGIVSSKISEKYNKPSLIFTNSGEYFKASGRSISSINLYKELKPFENYFEKFGGHSQAVGLSIKKEKYLSFTKEIIDIFNNKFDFKDFRKTIQLDSELKGEYINIDAFEEIKILEPYGYGNSRPKFLYRDFTINKIQKIGKEKTHMKVSTEKDGVLIELLYFNYKKEELQSLMYYKEVICTLDLNYFRGSKCPQLILKDINNYLLYEEKKTYIKILIKLKKIDLEKKPSLNYEKKIIITEEDIDDLKKHIENDNLYFEKDKIKQTLISWIPRDEEYKAVINLISNTNKKTMKLNIFKLIKYLKENHKILVNPEKILYTLEKEESLKKIIYKLNKNDIFIKRI